jgi:hypothetical protein
VAKESRHRQWSALTEEKKKNQLAQTEFRFVKNQIRGGNYPLAFASISALRSGDSLLPLGMMVLCRFIFGFGLSYIYLLYSVLA